MTRTPNPVTRVFLLNPTFAIIVVAFCLISGWFALERMTRENFPDLSIPQATVSVEWPGASAEQVEKEITKALEDNLRSLPGLKEFSSSSRTNLALVSVEFQAEADLSEAMQLLRARVADAEARFPGAAKRPVIEQVAVSDLPILTLVVTGQADPETLNVEAERLRRAVERLDGVRRVGLQGARRQVAHVRLDASRLASFSISPVEVRERLISANQDLSWGEIQGEQQTIPLYLQGRFRTAEDIAATPVAVFGDGQVIRVGDLGRVFIGLEQSTASTAASLNGDSYQDAVMMSVLKRPGSDTLATINTIQEFLSAEALPEGVQIAEITNEGEIIHASFGDVTTNLLQAIVAVFAILLVAMTWREASVAALAMPVTLLSAVLVIFLMGFSLNTLVALGMVIALGILVDVFILVMEGMHNAIKIRGLSFEEAATDTLKTYLLPAVAGQVTTILAMAPLLAIGGTDGKFIQLIPLTAIACLVGSLFIAFLVCIPLSRAVFAGVKSGEHKQSAVDRLSLRSSAALESWLLRGPLASRKNATGIVALGGVLLLASIAALSSLPSIVYPPEDRRNLGITVELSPDATFADADRVAELVGEYLRSRDELQHTIVHAGEKSPFAINTIDEYLLETRAPFLVGATVLFKPKSERTVASYDALADLRSGLEDTLAGEPGVVVRLTPDLGGSTPDDPIQIEIRGDDVKVLAALAREVQDALQAAPGVTDIRDTMGAFRTEARFRTDMAALTLLGIDEGSLLEQVRLATSSEEVGKLQTEGTRPDLDLIMGLDFPSRGNQIGGPRKVYEFEALSIITPERTRVPLATLVEVSFDAIPVAILHTDGVRTVTIRGQLQPGFTAEAALAALTPELNRLAERWPTGYSYRLRGEAETAAEIYGNTGTALMAALLLVFSVLAMMFQSFRQPLIILTTAAMGLIGLGLGFFVLQLPVSFPAMIGTIALLGIVVNNAIVMVEVSNARRSEGLPLADSAARGASERLRPIVTTSITTIAGLFPLALSSPAWFPLCMAVILGLSVSTVFGLVLIPALYLLLTPQTDC